MKIKQTNPDGVEEEIEVMSPQEVQAKLDAEKAALEEGHKSVVGEKDTTITNLAKDKTDLEAKIAKMELEGIKEDHPNFKILKDALGKKDADIAALKSSIDADKAQRISEEMDSKIKIGTRGNDELEKKVRFHLKETLSGLKEDTKEQRQTKLEHALKLASDNSNAGPGMFDMGANSGGMGDGSYGGGGGASGPEFTSREKALGAKLGISDADYKKYGSKLTNKNK
tara:strand:- start:1859 stop:2536 length:678 start_codon:yes stop_codon:yes gene_type:complete